MFYYLSNHISLDEKMIFCWLCFAQVVQKRTLGKVGNWKIVWWQVVSGIFRLKVSKSDNWFSSFSQKCRGCFFGTQCISLISSLTLYSFYTIRLARRAHRRALELAWWACYLKSVREAVWRNDERSSCKRGIRSIILRSKYVAYRTYEVVFLSMKWQIYQTVNVFLSNAACKVCCYITIWCEVSERYNYMVGL